MMWAGRPLMAYALYMPAAVAGVLLPHTVAGRMRPQHFLWGFALFTGALAELLSWGGLGLAYTLALWAMCALGLAACCTSVRGLSFSWLIAGCMTALGRSEFGLVVQWRTIPCERSCSGRYLTEPVEQRGS